MEIGKFKLAKADLVRPPRKPIQEQIIPQEKPYTKEVFQVEVEPFIKGFIGGFPKNEMTTKLQSILDKAVEKGALSVDEGTTYMRNRKQQLLDFVKQNPGQTLPELTRENFSVGGGVRSGPKSSGDMEGALKYLKTLKPGTAVNTYAIGKQFDVAPASIAGQVQRNFPELKLQTRKESAAKATETRRELYKQKQSDVPVVETKIRGSGKEARGKGRDIIGIRFPNEQMKNDYIQDLTDRYSDVKGRKGLTNKELAEKYLGSSNSNDIGRIERINNYFVKNLNLEYKKAPVSETKEKRTRRLIITQGGKTFKGTEDIPFHHIMPIGGEVPLTTKDVGFITKKMNSTLAPYNTKLNDIADAISNQLNNQEPGYLKRIDELNNQAEQIIESAKTKLPKKYQNYIGFNRLDPIFDEYGTPMRLNVTRVGVDDSKSLAGKKGSAIPLETLTQSKIDQFNTKVDQTFNKMTEVFKDPKFKSVLQNSGLTLRSLGQLRQRNIPGFIDTMKKLINKNPELRAELGNDYADIENMYASAATMSDVSPVKPDTGIPEEAVAGATVGAVKYGPQILNVLKNVGAQTIKPMVSPLAAVGFAGSELVGEDPNLSAAGMQMFYPEIFKQVGTKFKNAQGVYDRLLNLGLPVKDAARVARGFTGLGSLMIGGDIAYGLKERIGPSQRGPLTEQELLDMRGKETYMGNIADTFDKAYQTRSNFRGGDAARSDAASGRDAGRASPSGGVDDRGSKEQNLNQQGIVAAAKIRNAQPQKSPFQTFLDHSLFTKGLKRVRSIPNYHQLGGFDFMSRFPNTPPSVAKGLGYAYQGLTEFGKSLTDPDYSLEEAYDRAKEEGRLNAVGIDDFFDPNSLTAQQYYTLEPTLAPNYAVGGRVGFAEGPEDPSKRKFMKIMGGLASLPIVGRFFDVAQVAEKAAPAVVETFKNAPPHFVGLVNKIRALGEVVDPKKLLLPSEQKRYSKVYDYGDYRMYEKPDGGIEISKDKLIGTDYGDAKVSEEYMSYNPKVPKYNKKGEKIPDEYTDEYDEYTAYADSDGKMKDVHEGVLDDTINEGTYSKEELEQLIIEQVEQNLKKGKK